MADNEKNSKKGKASIKTTNKKTTNTKSDKASSSKKKVIKKASNQTQKKENTSKNGKYDIKEATLKSESIKEEEKEEKKENIKQARKQLYYNNNSNSDELSKLIKIVLIVTVIIVVFYGVTVVVTNKAKEAAEDKNKQAAEIQYDSIMLGSMLNIDGSYYVLIENQDDISLSEYTTLIQTIKANDDAPTIYIADLSSSFNRDYLGDKNNYDSDMETFKVTGTTLVRISNHKIIDVYDNHDDIVKKLDELD